jgi:hypothetical protein
MFFSKNVHKTATCTAKLYQNPLTIVIVYKIYCGRLGPVNIQAKQMMVDAKLSLDLNYDPAFHRPWPYGQTVLSISVKNSVK